MKRRSTWITADPAPSDAPYQPLIRITGEPEVFVSEKSTKAFVTLMGWITGAVGVVILIQLVASIMGWRS